MKIRSTWKGSDEPVPGDIRERALADMAEIEREDWRPIDNEDNYVYVEGLTFPPGSLFCRGRRGTVFISSPNGKLTICPYAEDVRAQ